MKLRKKSKGRKKKNKNAPSLMCRTDFFSSLIFYQCWAHWVWMLHRQGAWGLLGRGGGVQIPPQEWCMHQRAIWRTIEDIILIFTYFQIKMVLQYWGTRRRDGHPISLRQEINRRKVKMEGRKQIVLLLKGSGKNRKREKTKGMERYLARRIFLLSGGHNLAGDRRWWNQ